MQFFQNNLVSMSFVNHPQILQHDIRKLQQSVVANSQHPHDEDKVEEELTARMKLKYTETELSYLKALLRKKHWQFAAGHHHSGRSSGAVRHEDRSAELRPSFRPNPRRHFPRPPIAGSGHSLGRIPGPHAAIGDSLDSSADVEHIPGTSVRQTQALIVPESTSNSSLKRGPITRSPRLKNQPLQDNSYTKASLLPRGLPTVASVPSAPQPKLIQKTVHATGVAARMRHYSRHVKDTFVPVVDSSKALAISLRNCSASNFKPLRDIPRMQLFNARAW